MAISIRRADSSHHIGVEPSARRPQARVLYISPQPFFESRGTPLRVLQMIRALCAAGHEVHLASFPIGSAMPVAGMVHHRAAGIPGIRFVPIGFSLRKIALDAMLAVRSWRLMLTRRFDVVHCVEESVFFALPLARLRGIPVIFDLNSSVAHSLEYSGAVRNPVLIRWAKRLQAAALRRSQLAITVGESLSEEGVRSLGVTMPIAEIEDCPMAESIRDADPTAVSVIRRRHRLERNPIVVYTGNLAAYQGIDLLFDAVPALIARCPAARVLVVGGDAREIEWSRSMLAERGIGEYVVFAGQQAPERMPDYMGAADVLVSPRRGGRNTPLKLYSYMHSGRPIVATDLPTHTQVLDRTTAVLCDASPAALAEALAAVLAHPESYEALGIAARRRVAERYSEAAFSRKLLDAYDRLLEGARTS